MKLLALLSDFGLRDHFVATMKGVALSVNLDLNILDVTHDIAPYDIWEGSITLTETIPYWPTDTVFVAVVDPGVGTERRTVVVRTRQGHLVVGPDNGLFTQLRLKGQIDKVRKINQNLHRRPNSTIHKTFEGRDLFVYVGAQLAAEKITFDEVGTLIAPSEMVYLEHQKEERVGDEVMGTIMKIELPFGNVVTNISAETIDDERLHYGNEIRVVILEEGNTRFEKRLLLVKTFGDLVSKRALAYIDSSRKLGLAINQGNFARQFELSAGPNWRISVGLHL